MDFVKLVQGTPVPTILIVAGIFFLFLSIAGGFSGKINVPPARQKLAAIVGGIMLAIGLGMYFVPVNDTAKSDGETATQAPSRDEENIPREVTGKEPVEKDFRMWSLAGETAFTTANGSGWHKGDKKDSDYGFTIRHVSGKYRWEVGVATPKSYYVLAPYEPGLDFYLATDVKIEAAHADRPLLAGVLFRREGNRYYTLYLHSNRYFSVQYMDGTKNTPVIDWVYIPNIDPAVLNRIGVLAKGDLIQIYINDKLYGETNHSLLRGGSTGFIVEANESRGGEGSVDFDNYEYRIRR